LYSFKIIILFFLLLFLSSCASDVVFEESQPQGIRLKKKIPKKLRGLYQNLEDETDIIEIRKKLVLNYEEGLENKPDTLLDITDTSSISKYKEYYYLNIKLEVEKWLVAPVKLKNDTLTFWSRTRSGRDLGTKNYVREVEERDENGTIDLIYYAKPNREELQYFLQKEYLMINQST